MVRFNFSLSELDSMYPYERDIYLALLIEHLEKQKEAKS